MVSQLAALLRPPHDRSSRGNPHNIGDTIEYVRPWLAASDCTPATSGHLSPVLHASLPGERFARPPTRNRAGPHRPGLAGIDPAEGARRRLRVEAPPGRETVITQAVKTATTGRGFG
jgi:hypothetical protein